MAELRINGVSINNYTYPVAKAGVGNKHPAIPEKLRGISTVYDSGDYKMITGWALPNDNGWSTNSNYDSACGKIKVNGVVTPIHYDGTRPRNTGCVFGATGTSMTYYLNNVNGYLYVSTSQQSTEGTFIVASKAKNKDVIVNIALFGSGGKGGGGAYWFLAGNWGGVGGAGGAKTLVTVCVKNNDYFKIVTDSDSDYKGRTTDSSDTTYQSPGIRMYKSSGTQWILCTGGYSGTANHPRWHSDGYGGGGSHSVQTYAVLPTIKRKYATGGSKVGNGQSGSSCTFDNYASPYWGNPENYQGSVDATGYGGTGPDSSYTQSHGSGGAGGYGNGGSAGDTGSGSNGSAGVNGGGGGGSGSPAGGASGGTGGLPGFFIFY